MISCTTIVPYTPPINSEKFIRGEMEKARAMGSIVVSEFASCVFEALHRIPRNTFEVSVGSWMAVVPYSPPLAPAEFMRREMERVREAHDGGLAFQRTPLASATKLDAVRVRLTPCFYVASNRDWEGGLFTRQ